MRDFEVHFAGAACKEISKLPKPAQEQVMKAIDALHDDPTPQGVEKLRSHPSYFRLRSGDFRVIYSVLRKPKKLVVVLVVRDRKDAFKGLKNLDKKLAAAVTQLSKSMLHISEHQGSA